VGGYVPPPVVYFLFCHRSTWTPPHRKIELKTASKRKSGHKGTAQRKHFQRLCFLVS
jgi:hypothetical protein